MKLSGEVRNSYGFFKISTVFLDIDAGSSEHATNGKHGYQGRRRKSRELHGGLAVLVL